MSERGKEFTSKTQQSKSTAHASSSTDQHLFSALVVELGKGDAVSLGAEQGRARALPPCAAAVEMKQTIQ